MRKITSAQLAKLTHIRQKNGGNQVAREARKLAVGEFLEVKEGDITKMGLKADTNLHSLVAGMRDNEGKEMRFGIRTYLTSRVVTRKA